MHFSPPHLDEASADPNELARRALGGCEHAAAELVRRYRPRLCMIVAKRLGPSHHDAEDVVQETLARAFGSLDRFDPQRRFSTWLYTIALRLTCDHARRRARRPRSVSLDQAPDDVLAVETPAPVAAQERGNVWGVAHAALSEPEFTALWLRYGEDLTPAEVARAMDRTGIGVRVLLHRARARLAVLLAARAVSEETAETPSGAKSHD